MTRPYMIGIVGISGSGKTALADHLADQLGEHQSQVFSLDAYYKHRPKLSSSEKGSVNYDEPSAIDVTLLTAHLVRLSIGLPVDKPTYNFSGHERSKVTEHIRPSHYLIAEGHLLLHWPKLRALFDITIFITIDKTTALKRRLARDTRDRGRTEESVLTQWTTTVEPMFLRYIEPTQRYANLVINGNQPTTIMATTVLGQIKNEIKTRASQD